MTDRLSFGAIFDDPHHPVFHGNAHFELAISEIRELDVDFGVLPLSRPAYSTLEESVPTQSDFILVPSAWNTQLLIQIPPQVVNDLESAEITVRIAAETRFRELAAWACHLSMPALYLPPPPCHPAANYARMIRETLLPVGVSLAVWVELPMFLPDGGSTWPWWDFIRTTCEGNASVKLVLRINAPDSIAPPAVLERWFAEPLAAVVFPTEAFTTNTKMYPTLRKHHQHLYVQLVKRGGVQFLFSGPPRHAPPPIGASKHKERMPDPDEQEEENEEDKEGGAVELNPGMAAYRRKYILYKNYLIFLAKQSVPPMTQGERYIAPYRDYLQSPLQPLQDHLESTTYETFERDPVKYRQYEAALYQAFLTHPALQANPSPLVMVMGAGRGPLIRCVFRAYQRAMQAKGAIAPVAECAESDIIPIAGVLMKAPSPSSPPSGLRVVALEKNPNAAVTLRAMGGTEWPASVSVIEANMRDPAPHPLHGKADVIVSELLGSFGDNELSPECLDGAVRWLKPATGISIPRRSRSFLSPVSCPVLHQELLHTRALDTTSHSGASGIGAVTETWNVFETAYVVQFHKVAVLAPPEEVFAFDHPARAAAPGAPYTLPESNLHNQRYTRLRFTVTSTGRCHGFAGYFDSDLYGDANLSIHPGTHTPDMYSWFPIYFPLHTPILVREGEVMEVHFWRNVGAHKVWYEWATSSPVVSPIHNPGGRSYFVGL